MDKLSSSISIRQQKALELLQELDADSVDLVLTDPPYNVDLDYDEYEDDLSYDDYWNWMQEIFSEAERVLKDSGALAIVTPHNQLRDWFALFDELNLEEVPGSPIIWYRPNHVGYKNRGYSHSVYPIHVLEAEEHEMLNPPKQADVTSFNHVEAVGPQSGFSGLQKKVHPAQQPVKAYEKFVLKHCPEDGVVVDPFLGSGTSAVVCKKWGRNFIGSEISEEYIEKARERELAKPPKRSCLLRRYFLMNNMGQLLVEQSFMGELAGSIPAWRLAPSIRVGMAPTLLFSYSKPLTRGSNIGPTLLELECWNPHV